MPRAQPSTERGSFDRDQHGFTGFGRAAVDRDGHYSFTTVKPGATREGSAPYLLVTVFARGVLHHLFTRAYFDDEAEANAADPLLARVDADSPADAHRRVRCPGLVPLRHPAAGRRRDRVPRLRHRGVSRMGR